MKTRLLFPLLAIAAIALGTGLYQLGKHQSMAMPATASAVADKPADKKVLYWHDPMVPGQKFDKPGPSPFMDMELVPVYADAGSDAGGVAVSPRMQQNLGVRTATVTSGSLPATFAAVGTVAWNERDMVVLQARANGFVERVPVRAVLDPVRQGQTLVELTVPEWVAAQEDFLTVQRLPDNALLLDGARQRMVLVGMNDTQIAQIARSGKVQARMTLRAPVNGVITELSIRPGSTVMAGAPLLRINGTSTVWLQAELPESLVARVTPGMAVTAQIAALPGKTFSGRVDAILPDVSTVTRTLKVRIELTNPAGLLAPGMFATVQFSAPAGAPVLLIPTEAVIRTGTRTVVMLANDGGTFTPADITTGTEENGQTVVLRGLEAGQKVVSSGQFLIDSDASLKGITSRMSAP
ncbi:MAG: Cu(I)/Ag(I) efflux system membrane fusion protein [Burkholderiaceae bacterium]|jgi:Cu(I)/Ag(I) efflux system membrane fusion protein